MRSILLIAFLFTTGLVFAASNPPTPSETKGGTQKQEQSANPSKESCNNKDCPNVSPVTINVTPSQTINEQTTRKPYHERDKSSAEWLTAMGTVALAVITGFLAFFTYWLWRSTSKLVIGAEKTAERQLRAYVSVKNVEILPLIHPDPVTGTGYRITINWENTGQTPTRKAITNINHLLLPGNISEFPEGWGFKDGETMRSALIGPHQVVAAEGVNIHTVDTESIANRTKSLYIWGWVEYNDVFDKTPRHRTEFCDRVTIKGGGTNQIPLLWGLEPTKNHNGADDECYRQPKPYSEI